MSEQGFGDTLQFSRYALHLQQQELDVTLLSFLLVPLLRDSVGLKQVMGQLDSDRLAEQQPIWLLCSMCFLPYSLQAMGAIQHWLSAG